MSGGFEGVERRDGRSGLQALDQHVDAEFGGAVGGLDVAVEPGVGDDLDHVLEMVEDEDRVDKLEERFGQTVRVVFGGLDAGLEVADGLVAQVADRAAVEGRQIGIGHEVEAAQFGLDLIERIDAAAGRRAVDAVRFSADEGVAAGALAAFDRLEQERVCAALDLEEGRDRGFQVGEHLAVDGGVVAAARGLGVGGDLFEFVQAGVEFAGLRHGNRLLG